MKTIIDSLRRAAGMYDSNGLKYSLAHLRRVERDIAFFPIEKQSSYANTTTIAIVSEGRDDSVLKEVDLQREFPLHPVAVGNLAYIALNSESISRRVKATLLLEQYSKWAQDRGWGSVSQRKKSDSMPTLAIISLGVIAAVEIAVATVIFFK